jgi:beta-glucosidase
MPARSSVPRLTFPERVAQLRGVRAIDLLDAHARFDPARAAALMPDGIGFIGQPGDFCHPTGLDSAQVAAFVADAQAWLRAHTRPGLPALVHEECLSGATVRGATIYPQMLCLASTWDASLAGRMTEQIRHRLLALGVRAGLSPVLDLGRDARLGRIEETFGEDPVLAAAFAVAYVRGLQTTDLRAGVAATGKHFLGQGGNMGGHFPGAFSAGPREQRHVWAYPFEAAIRQADLALVMHGYHEIDGLPCALNAPLLRDLLRRDLGFAGLVVSDYFALKHLAEIYKLSADPHVAVERATLAGVDVELPDGSRWQQVLASGRALSPALRRAVLAASDRVLALKQKLGLLAAPSAPLTRRAAPSPEPSARALAAERALARDIALRGITLLENRDSFLPLDPDTLRRVAIIGPNAHDPAALCGDYAWPAAHRWQKHPLLPDQLPRQTFFTALRDALAPHAVAVEHASGGTLHATTPAQLRAAARLARSADVTILVLGEQAGLTSGEGKDAKTLAPTGHQRALFDALVATGRPLVTVFACGRPLAFGDFAAGSRALLAAWYPGEEGAAALADILLGRAAPSGRLPVSVPKSVGHVPCHYSRHDFTGHGFADGAYPFGYGLTTTTFAWDNFIAPARVVLGRSIVASVRITNTGPRAATECVQLYVRHAESPCARPPHELKAFARVTLAPGASHTVRFRLAPDLLAAPDAHNRLVLAPGELRLSFAPNARDLHPPLPVLLTGRPLTFAHRETFFATA